MPRFASLTLRADRVVTRTTAVLTGTLLAAMSVLVVTLVIARYVFAAPIFWGEEMARFMTFYLVMIGSALAIRQDQHPRLTMLRALLPLPIQRGLDVLTDAVVFGTLSILFLHGIDLALEEAIMTSPSLRISYLWVYLGYPIGAGLSILQLVGRRLQDDPLATSHSTAEILQ